MKTAAGTGSFSAHGGMRDIPRGAVPLQRIAPVPKQQHRSWTGVLMILLALSMVLLYSQYAEEIKLYVNRPVGTVLMENSLQMVDEQRVRGVLARHLSTGFFAVDVRGIKMELEADPWVDQAIVTRVWPDTLSVAITEEIAIARWGAGSLLNQYGEIFIPDVISEDLALPLLSGPEGAQQRVMEQYQTISQMLFSSGLRVRELTLSERGSWSMRMHNDVTVTIGRSEVIERLQRFLELHDRHLVSQIDQIDALDLRYRNGISIRKKAVMSGGVASK